MKGIYKGDVEDIRYIFNTGKFTMSNIARCYGVHDNTIRKIVRNKTSEVK